MEMEYSSLQEQISRANNHYQELCEIQDRHIQKCKQISQELIEVEKAINSFCGTIHSATKMSHIGASQAISAMQNSAGLLNIVYQLLHSGRSYGNISFSSGSASNSMIHYSPEIASKQSKLAKQSKDAAAKGTDMQNHMSILEEEIGEEFEIYRAKAENAAEELWALGEYMGRFAEHIAKANRRYGEAQIEALVRANKIPY